MRRLVGVKVGIWRVFGDGCGYFIGFSDHDIGPLVGGEYIKGGFSIVSFGAEFILEGLKEADDVGLH
jgi:hypothetical protein